MEEATSLSRGAAQTLHINCLQPRAGLAPGTAYHIRLECPCRRIQLTLGLNRRHFCAIYRECSCAFRCGNAKSPRISAKKNRGLRGAFHFVVFGARYRYPEFGITVRIWSVRLKERFISTVDQAPLSAFSSAEPLDNQGVPAPISRLLLGSGATGRNRTDNLRITNALLYH